jgi:uncharacterized protein (TIGR03643 family)
MKEEIAYFTEMFHDLLSLFTQPFQSEHLIFLMKYFWNIAKLENVLLMIPQKKWMETEVQNISIYINRTFFLDCTTQCLTFSSNKSGKDRVIEMAWEDRSLWSNFMQFGLKEQEVIDLMRWWNLQALECGGARTRSKTKHENCATYWGSL